MAWRDFLVQCTEKQSDFTDLSTSEVNGISIWSRPPERSRICLACSRSRKCKLQRTNERMNESIVKIWIDPVDQCNYLNSFLLSVKKLHSYTYSQLIKHILPHKQTRKVFIKKHKLIKNIHHIINYIIYNNIPLLYYYVYCAQCNEITIK